MKRFRFSFSSLRSKLLAMFVILTCVPLIVVGLISYQKSFDALSGNNKASTMLAADGLGRDIDVLFQDTGKLLELSKNPQVLRYLFSQTDTYDDAKSILETFDLYRETYKYESVLNISMVNLYGRGISERRGVFQLDKNPLRNPHFVYLVNHPDEVLNVPPIESLTLDRLDGFQYENQNVISIVAAVKQQITREVIGFIVIDLDDKIVKQFCDSITIGKTGFFYVADANGSPIFTPSQMNSEELGEPVLLAEKLAASRDSYVDHSTGKPAFIMFTTSAMTGWKIIGRVPLQEIVQDANEIRQLIIISVSLSILFTIASYFFITSRITRPVQLLMHKMRQASSGYLEAKVKAHGQDEIADLGNSFNRMIEKIKALLEQSIREKEQVQKAELRTLQAQINPHFLYNTLDSIVWMAEARKHEQVIHLVQALSRFFRISLNKGMDWVHMQEELEHVRSYLVIQQMRYQDILDYEIDVPQELMNVPILKMTLQPIVENALYHGIKNKRGKGLIRITGQSRPGGEIWLSVTDNGIGMTEDTLQKLRDKLIKPPAPELAGTTEPSGGFGLYNVHQRIRLYFGDYFGVGIESEYQAGTTISIRIPNQWGVQTDEKNNAG
ncbi:sensor histidine kinase [Paenibacillus sp. NEAU-GSW1]|uniref:cache domain-containing sensor histidine kinase n=1 Tax=Paenibacillus sp. NEAU-GSW1 TaxID=2682486 RepID=UPI0012E16059|nr:sensor histidine kinase [Paenibacillus sp. NEAU-GSW1]MUT67182.1 HAMP domain-containing protein [Paenibacillus sp. NEAU-GSW1]